MIRVYCRNTDTYKEFQEGTSLLEMLPEFDIKPEFPIVSAKVNNVSQGLKFKVFNNRDIEYLDVREPSGMRVYTRSLFFLLCKATSETFPGSRAYIEHPLSGGYYCNIRKKDDSALSSEDIDRIRERMQTIVDENVAFHRREVQVEEAIKIFRDRGFYDKVRLLETSGQVYTDYYLLGETPDYYYGRLVPSAGFLKLWAIEKCHDGLLLRVPDRHNPAELAPFFPQPKTFEIFSENLRWSIIMGLNNIGDVNYSCSRGRASEMIQVAEALQEKKIVQIAEEIYRRYNDPTSPVRVVLITGPSSSGKTTVCKRLSIQLLACGLRPISFSTDDYFVNRVDTPLLPDGSYDFDNFDTVDHEALQNDLLALLDGKEVSVPEYNFTTGIREYNGKKLRLREGSVLIIEGIHALNPRLTDKVSESKKFKIFISTLTSISIDNHNCIPTSDNRLLRRIIRDSNKGAFTARETISQWQNVLDAEEKWINPYQDSADVMFNSAYLVEFAVLRNHAESILADVPKNCPEYAEAHRLLKFIHYFTPVSDKEIPPTSLLREFVGGSSFKY